MLAGLSACGVQAESPFVDAHRARAKETFNAAAMNASSALEGLGVGQFICDKQQRLF